MNLTASQITGIDKAMRNYQLETGQNFSAFIQESIIDPLYGGSIGITASAAEVDAIAKGGNFAWDGSTASLNFAYGAGRVHNGKTMVSVSAGSIALSASATNYIEVDRAGTVSANTTAFTSARMPLWTVVTGTSTISTVTNSKPLLTLIGTNGVDGSMLSTPGQTKEISSSVPTVATAAGDTLITLQVPKEIAAASRITNISLVFKDALAASDTNYVKFGLVNKGAAGAGTQTLVDITDAANSTKVTGGTALAAYTRRNLTLVTLSGGSERDVTGGDTLLLTITAVGTLANTLTTGNVKAEFSFSN